jgi:hypothetical protein
LVIEDMCTLRLQSSTQALAVALYRASQDHKNSEA